MTMAVTISASERLVTGLVEPQKTGAAPATVSPQTDQPAFADMITDLIESVDSLQNESAQTQQAFLAGEPVELHQLMIKAEEAGVAMDLLLEIRNKLLDAYANIMKMPM